MHRRAGGSVVVRLADDIPDHGILRFNEVAAARAAFAAGLSPEVIAAGPGFLVTRFLNGRPLTSDEVRAPANLPRIVDLLRRCHTDIPKHFRGPALIFWVFQVIRSYAGLLVDDGSRLAPELPRLLAVTEELERTVGPVEIVFGHKTCCPAICSTTASGSGCSIGIMPASTPACSTSPTSPPTTAFPPATRPTSSPSMPAPRPRPRGSGRSRR